MADEAQLALLRRGVDAWRHWQHTNTHIRADLRDADLSGMELRGVLLSHAELLGANLSGANLSDAWLVEANLRFARLSGAMLCGASLANAHFSDESDLSDANLASANLYGADLSGADLSRADLSNANLSKARLVGTNLTDANLSGSRIYGISAWDLKLGGTKQDNLVITPEDPGITVDNIEVGQFIYLLLHNERIREVIDTVTAKVVLLLGRFTSDRKAVLDALRQTLRQNDYLPVVFDFEGPQTRDITETVSLLARMARFIIVDLSSPRSVPKELEAIVPSLAVPVQPIIEGPASPYSMFTDYWKYDWVLPIYRYPALEPLLENARDRVIAPAEEKVRALEERRRRAEEMLRAAPQ